MSSTSIVSQDSIYAYIIDPISTTIWGFTPKQRLERQLAKLKVTIVDDISSLQDKGDILLLRGDVVFDTSILQGLLSLDNTAITCEKESDTVVVAVRAHGNKADAALELLTQNKTGEGIRVLSAEEAAGAYQHQLRKREKPYCLVISPESKKQAETRVFMGAYKGITDLVTKYAWPIPAMWATHLCIRLKLSPNMVTTAGFILTLLATWWFWKGEYGLGLVAAWIMTFLDTVDGKLARVTFTSSFWGNIFDHGIDLIHPPFWYWAWLLGLGNVGMALSSSMFDAVIYTIFGAYIAGRVLEGYFMRRFGFHLHVWRKFDSFFRLILARRNPNMIILTLCWFVGAADTGVILVALWTLITFLVHIVQLIQAEIHHAKGNQVTSWLSH